MYQEIQEKFKLWRPRDDAGMLPNLRKSPALGQTSESGTSGILNG